MSSAKPWDRLTSPSISHELNVMLVDDKHPWDLYWGRSKDHCLLVARLNGPISVPPRLPKFKGVRLTLDAGHSGNVRSLILELLDGKSDDIFLKLCQDIVESTRKSASEQEIVQEMVARTWMWHRFLKMGKSELLTPEEQRGLIAELTVLHQICIPVCGQVVGVKGWTGSFGTARDFEYGAICLESKAKRAASLPFVDINSEFQLDPDGLDALFLFVIEVTAASSTTGQTLNAIVESVRDSLSVGGEALEELDDRLMAAGYRGTDDYSEWSWAVGETEVFNVTKDFPSIRHSALHPGVSDVGYRLSLKQCQPYEVTQSQVEAVLGEVTNGQ